MDLHVNTKKAKKSAGIEFKPRKTPRMVLSSVNTAEACQDLKTYNAHRLRVFKATSVVDNHPPKLHPYNYVNLKKIKKDVDRMVEIDRENRALVCKINRAHQAPAIVDCWQSFSRKRRHSLQKQLDEINEIINRNLHLYNHIKTSKSVYDRGDLKKQFSRVMEVFRACIKLPQVLHVRKPFDSFVNESASITDGLTNEDHLPRPKVFMDFNISCTSLGRITIEVYTDYPSETVENFLNHCAGTAEFSYEDCAVCYGEKCKFFHSGSAPVKDLQGHCIYDREFPARPNDLHHNRVGVVSAVPYQKPDKFKKGARPILSAKNPITTDNSSVFSVTLCPMPEWDGRRTVIGKVIKGNDVLCKINDMLKRCGTPLERIFISSCGVLPYTKDELDLLNEGDGQG